MLYEVITLSEGSNSAGASIAGVLPHRTRGGEARSSSGLNALEMLENALEVTVITSYSIHYTKLYECERRRVLSLLLLGRAWLRQGSAGRRLCSRLPAYGRSADLRPHSIAEKDQANQHDRPVITDQWRKNTRHWLLG